MNVSENSFLKFHLLVHGRVTLSPKGQSKQFSALYAAYKHND